MKTPDILRNTSLDDFSVLMALDDVGFELRYIICLPTRDKNPDTGDFSHRSPDELIFLVEEKNLHFINL